MSSVLLACFSAPDQVTLDLLSQELRLRGHRIAFVCPLTDVPDVPKNARRYECQLDGFSSADEVPPENFFEGAVPRSFDSKQRRLFLDMLPELIPNHNSIFPYRVAYWSKAYRRVLEEALHHFKPQVAVLSLGKLETPLVRETCAHAGVSCVSILPVFYEFKTSEPVGSLGAGLNQDRYCVSGPQGKSILVSAGVESDHISITGNPAADGIRQSTASQCKSIQKNRPTILYAMQRLPDNNRLLLCLIDYLERQENTQLVIRFHPSVIRRERVAVGQLFAARHVRSRVAVSVGRTLAEDIERSSALVTISSLSCISALLQGVPVICWDPSNLLPHELVFSSTHLVETVRHSGHLNNALDQILSAPHSVRREIPELLAQYVSPTTLPSHKLICDEIEAVLQRAMPESVRF